MKKIEITVMGKRALVDADQVKKLQRKDSLVAGAIQLQKDMAATDDPFVKAKLFDDLNSTMAKIIRLNRSIRQNVQFL